MNHSIRSLLILQTLLYLTGCFPEIPIGIDYYSYEYHYGWSDKKGEGLLDLLDTDRRGAVARFDDQYGFFYNYLDESGSRELWLIKKVKQGKKYITFQKLDSFTYMYDQYDKQNDYEWRFFLHQNTPCSIETDKNKDQIAILINIGSSKGNLPVKMFFANTETESLEEMPTKDIQCFMFWGY